MINTCFSWFLNGFEATGYVPHGRFNSENRLVEPTRGPLWRANVMGEFPIAGVNTRVLTLIWPTGYQPSGWGVLTNNMTIIPHWLFDYNPLWRWISVISAKSTWHWKFQSRNFTARRQGRPGKLIVGHCWFLNLAIGRCQKLNTDASSQGFFSLSGTPMRKALNWKFQVGWHELLMVLPSLLPIYTCSNILRLWKLMDTFGSQFWEWPAGIVVPQNLFTIFW